MNFFSQNLLLIPLKIVFSQTKQRGQRQSGATFRSFHTILSVLWIPVIFLSGSSFLKRTNTELEYKSEQNWIDPADLRPDLQPRCLHTQKKYESLFYHNNLAHIIFLFKGCHAILVILLISRREFQF